MKNSAPLLRLKCCNDDVAVTEKENKTKKKNQKFPRKHFCVRFLFQKKIEKMFLKKGRKILWRKILLQLV
jgi:hypothetical protein